VKSLRSSVERSREHGEQEGGMRRCRVSITGEAVRSTHALETDPGESDGGGLCGRREVEVEVAPVAFDKLARIRFAGHLPRTAAVCIAPCLQLAQRNCVYGSRADLYGDRPSVGRFRGFAR
jgi:hypothetical protein